MALRSNLSRGASLWAIYENALRAPRFFQRGAINPCIKNNLLFTAGHYVRRIGEPQVGNTGERGKRSNLVAGTTLRGERNDEISEA